MKCSIRNTFGLLAAAAILIGLGAAPALAAPELGVTLERDSAEFPVVRHSDERVDFTVKVKNIGSEAPIALGDTLRCIDSPREGWFGSPTPTFSYQWMRNGAPIGGATSSTYTVTTADEGRTIQCVVTGINLVKVTNPPETVTARSSVASQPPIVVPPAPSPLPPSPANAGIGFAPFWRPRVFVSGSAETGKRTCRPPTGWTTTATANSTSGSEELKAMATAKGEGATSNGSNEVTGLRVEAGAFRVGQTVTITGSTVTAGTTIIAVSGNTLTLSNPVTAGGGANKTITAGSQPFTVGETIEAVSSTGGNILPAGTTITAISGQTIEVSNAATATSTNAVIWSAASGPWSFQWLRNATAIAGATASEYTPGAEDKNKNLQCQVVGKTGSGEAPGGGAAVGISSNSYTGTLEAGFAIPENLPNSTPFVASPSYAPSATVELELPGGEETFAYKTEPNSWSCEKLPLSPPQPAKVVCANGELKAPGAEYPALKVITALGADAPDTAVATATAFGPGMAAASAVLTFPVEPALPFGLSKFTAALLDEAENEYTQAGGHPFEGLSEVAVNQMRGLNLPAPPTFPGAPPVGQVKQVIVDLPRGIVGNQLALPALCAGTVAVKQGECPVGSIVGGISVQVFGVGSNAVIYAIEPEFGTPAQFAFEDAFQNVYTFSPRLRPEDGYAVSLELGAAPEVDFAEATTTFCDFGVKVPGGTPTCWKAGEAGANPKPLFTTPTRCGVSLTTRVRLDSWEDPTFVEGPPFANAPMEGCEAVPFEPEADLKPTSNQADSPTGLDVEVSMPTEGLEDPEGISQSNLREAKVTFPQGMAINPTAGQGLGACSKDQIKLGTNDPITCPDSSKIGTVEIDTPVIEETLKGAVYIAKQGEVEGSLVGFYMVFDSPKDGILVKLPAKVTPDPNTGQLTVTVAESPQQPFSAVRMHFPGGPRATLLTPPKCGTYQIKSELTPWSGGAPLTLNSSFSVNEGPGGGPCPTGALEPSFSAGSSNPLAGQRSPFNVRLSRPDGSDRFSALGLHLPPGLVAYLGGVPRCPEAAIAQARSREALGQGQTEIEDPSCPAASRIGSVVAGAGAGENPLYVDTGKAYLAGPYKGAPLSIVVIAPAVAGPLDLGAVVVRNAVDIDPQTAEVSVASDPIPTILHGVLLDIRDVRVAIDRPNFTLNPTDCEPLAVGARIAGLSGAVANLAKRFQVGGCESLGFKPKLRLRLRGGTKRGAHPALRAEVHPREGDANFAGAVVTLPRSAFLDQAHIRTICTRVQFAAHQCPAGSVYGQARAVTPLLDEPLEGPVYLRSSEHKLPDLVVALQGPPSLPLEFNLASRVDSVHGGIRSSFEAIPDVPVTEFTLEMQGGNKGLIVNSTDLCLAPHRVAADLSAQNGMAYEAEPALQAQCKKHRKGKAHKRRHGHHGAAR